MRIKLVVILTMLYLLASSCSEDEPVYDVPLTFQPYVDAFIIEAAKHGQTIDFSDTGLSIQFRDAVDQETGGVCKGNHQIEIEKFFWEDLSEFDKEGLIFHELGHCELNRRHRNDKLPNGEWASRMRGSPIPDGDNAVINYAGSRLEYYREEFFNTEIATPEWANRRLAYEESMIDEVKDNFFDVEEFDNAYIGLSNSNFEIEVTLNTGSSEGFVGVQFMGSSNADRIRVAYNRDKSFAIDSGNEVWGLMFFEEDLELISSGDNMITIRRVGDFYYVFLNREFIYWFDYKVPLRESVQSLNAGSLGVPVYKEVKVVSLL